MFEKFIKKLLSVLNNITKEIERAYYETYGDKELAEEFGFEVEMRKQKNKHAFVTTAARYIARKIYDKDNYLIPEGVAMQMGEMMFEAANNEGKIDMLNNCIE